MAEQIGPFTFLVGREGQQLVEINVTVQVHELFADVEVLQAHWNVLDFQKLITDAEFLAELSRRVEFEKKRRLKVGI